jgi:hypothetical protein
MDSARAITQATLLSSINAAEKLLVEAIQINLRLEGMETDLSGPKPQAVPPGNAAIPPNQPLLERLDCAHCALANELERMNRRLNTLHGLVGMEPQAAGMARRG